MRLQNIKMVVAAAWVVIAVIVGLVFGVTSSGGLVALVALGLLPPLAMLLLWNDPSQTLSESISKARR
jgi:hypothetical protein